MRSEVGVVKGDFWMQTPESHENKWEAVGRSELAYIHANQMVKISHHQ